MDTEKQRQRRRDDAKLTENRNARSEQLSASTRGAYRVANQQSMACLSGSRTSKARLVFGYEISDLLYLVTKNYYELAMIV